MKQQALILVFLLFSYSLIAGEKKVIYPSNPVISDKSAWLSAQGLTKFDRQSGQVEWRVLNGKNTFEPVLSRERLYLGSSDGLFAFDRNEGKLLWHFQAGETIFSPTVVDNILVTGSTSGKIWALNNLNGKVIWEKSFSGWNYQPVVQGGILITGGQEGVLRALDLKTGKILWQKPVGGEFVYRPIALSENLLAFTTFTGNLFLLRSGEIVWRKKDSVPGISFQAVENNLIYSGFNQVQSRQLSDGKQLWSYSLRGKQISLLPLSKNTLLANSDEQLVLLQVATGEPLWKRNIEGEILGIPLRRENKVFYFQRERNGKIRLVTSNISAFN
ncbi:MAG: hypothetical protein COB67_08570 [SAR324 cluster bacterium]|uniref:Pyrrolo-quinoline quinone repeat domain-containing protein n=1 Tax=SAR324 cluster bacterium TaxID=2024889 RepID=A0A2A4T325_9DELT|nr:MAG: hypothetical protein COB67_08570 [SAR324 cluster bacterium]